MRILIIIILIIAFPASALAQETVTLTIEEAAKCEVCVDQYRGLQKTAIQLEHDFNAMSGELNTCASQLWAERVALNDANRKLERLDFQVQQQPSDLVMYSGYGLAAVILGGFLVALATTD